MATATATFITSIDEGGKPTSGYRITGGTADDRLTMADVASALSGILDFDEETGVVSRAESAPTAYQFIFGSAAPRTRTDGTSTTTVLNVDSTEGFATTGLVRVDTTSSASQADEERDVASLTDTTITLASALSSAPNNNRWVIYYEGSCITDSRLLCVISRGYISFRK